MVSLTVIVFASLHDDAYILPKNVDFVKCSSIPWESIGARDGWRMMRDCCFNGSLPYRLSVRRKKEPPL
jgi:hypothetical protein